MSRPARGLLLCAVILGVALGSYFAARALISQGETQASSQPPAITDAEPAPEEQPTPSASPSPLTSAEISTLYKEDFEKPRFDGVIHGFRIAPGHVLAEEDPAPMPCRSEPVGAEVPTDMDFTPTYLPQTVTITRASGPGKSVCSDGAVYVGYGYDLETPFGIGLLEVSRMRLQQTSFLINAPADRIIASEVNGTPAVFVRPLHETGLGFAYILIIEDPVPDPYTRVLYLASDNLTFEELLKVAEGVQ